LAVNNGKVKQAKLKLFWKEAKLKLSWKFVIVTRYMS